MVDVGCGHVISSDHDRVELEDGHTSLSPHRKNRPDSDRGPNSNRRLPRTRDGAVNEVS